MLHMTSQELLSCLRTDAQTHSRCGYSSACAAHEAFPNPLRILHSGCAPKLSSQGDVMHRLGLTGLKSQPCTVMLGTNGISKHDKASADKQCKRGLPDVGMPAWLASCHSQEALNSSLQWSQFSTIKHIFNALDRLQCGVEMWCTILAPSLALHDINAYTCTETAMPCRILRAAWCNADGRPVPQVVHTCGVQWQLQVHCLMQQTLAHCEYGDWHISWQGKVVHSKLILHLLLLHQCAKNLQTCIMSKMCSNGHTGTSASA